MRKFALTVLLLALLLLAGCGGKHAVELDLSGVTMQPGESFKLNASCSDPDHGPCVWKSSDLGVAHVDKNGVVTAVAEGKATITAICEEGKDPVSSACLVTVNVCRIEFSFDNREGTILLGEEGTLSARVYINDERTVQPVEWGIRGDTDAVSIVFTDNTARISARALGTVTLTASYTMGDSLVSEDFTVILTDEINYHATLSRGSVQLFPDETCPVEVSLSPEAESFTVRWSSANPAVASVSADGIITAKTPGSTVVTASVTVDDSTVTAPCLVTVNRNEYTLRIGELTGPVHASDIVDLPAQITKNGAEFDGKVVWTVDNTALATVRNGRLNALCAGKVKLTAAFTSPEGDRFTDETELEILANEYALTLTAPKTELGTDETMMFDAVLTKNGAPLNGRLTWTSSDNLIAQVNDGKLVTLETGTVLIRAVYTPPRTENAPECSASIEIKVTASEYSLKMNYSYLSLKVGETAEISAEAYRGSSILEAVSIRYTVADSSIAAVTGGQVRAVGAGETEIIASWTDPEGEEHTALCAVSATTPYYIVLEPTELTLTAGGEIQIIATTLQRFEDGTEDECYEGEVSWQSSDPACVEVKAGVARAIATGSGPVTLTASWTAPDGAVCRAECTVTVTN